jgi:hypothetical protein
MQDLTYDKSSVAKQNLDIPAGLDSRLVRRSSSDPVATVYRQPSGVRATNEAGGEVPPSRYGR